MAKLRFEIKGESESISFVTYNAATTKLAQLIRELDVAISRRGNGSLKWYISDLSKNGSLAIEVRSEVRRLKDTKRPPLEDFSKQVAHSFVTGFENIESKCEGVENDGYNHK